MRLNREDRASQNYRCSSADHLPVIAKTPSCWSTGFTVTRMRFCTTSAKHHEIPSA